MLHRSDSPTREQKMIFVYNTLTKKKEQFEPLKPPRVGMYVCGITPYDKTHLGHARCYVAFDVIRRWLTYRGYYVKYVQNITDLDDKIINRARKEDRSELEVADEFISDFRRWMEWLGVMKPDIEPRVTGTIPEIIKFIQTLIQKGHAYTADGSVYFSVSSFPEYGNLSGQRIEDLIAGARVEPQTGKREPLDFALWKRAKPDEPSWESPWGKGRPGWHIECSVMSIMNLGPTFDIHGGGQDLIFPHHENERAQSEGATGKQFARYWLHNGFVTVHEEKMSKSLGNILAMEEVARNSSPAGVRYFLISQHYSRPIDYTPIRLKDAENGWKRLAGALENAEFQLERMGSSGEAEKVHSGGVLEQLENFEHAIDDDFNTSEALAALHNLAGMINENLSNENSSPEVLRDAFSTLKNLASVLGFQYQSRAVRRAVKGIDRIAIELINEREEARKDKDWERADSLRKQLDGMGYSVEDTPNGPRWKKK